MKKESKRWYSTLQLTGHEEVQVSTSGVILVTSPVV